jgi:hypothetical protein
MKEKGGILPFVFLIILFPVILLSWCLLNKNTLNTNSLNLIKIQSTPNPTLTNTTLKEQSQNNYIKILSPLGNNKWQVGKTETISWDQSGLEYWGNQLKICLFAFDEAQNPILPQTKYTDQLCTYKFGTLDGAYLITDVALTNKKFDWTIPEDLLGKFDKKPSVFKVSLQVYDNLPSAGRTEWGGLVGNDDSPNYFQIIE